MRLPKFSALSPLCLSELIFYFRLFAVQNCWIVLCIFWIGCAHCPVWCWALIFANYFQVFVVIIIAAQQIVIFVLCPLWPSGWANVMGIPTKYELYLYSLLIWISLSACSAQPPQGTSHQLAGPGHILIEVWSQCGQIDLPKWPYVWSQCEQMCWKFPPCTIPGVDK